MTETIEGMSSMPKEAMKSAKAGAVERAAVRELVRVARAREEDFTKQVLQSAPEERGSPRLRGR